ncbi:MAG: flagellar filament capping protein FliD [Thermodesulfovibrionales bacterium]
MGISSSGLISGLNVNDLVTQLISLEKTPLLQLQSKEQAYQVKISSVLDLSTKLSSFKSAVDKVNSQSIFNTKSASITQSAGGADLVTVSAAAEATAGSYSVRVDQLATANKKGSQGWTDENSTPISSVSGSFTFKVGPGGSETSVAVTTTTTLQGLKDAINSSGAAVTATILNDGTGSSPYRLVLTSKNTGADNAIYVTENDTQLDFSTNKIGFARASSSNTYTGTAASSGSFTGIANTSYLLSVVEKTAGVFELKYSTDSGATWKGLGGAAYSAAGDGIEINTTSPITIADGVKVAFSSTTGFATGDTFTLNAYNRIEAAYSKPTNSYSGAATSGGNYTGTTNKTFLVEMVSAGASETAAYKYSTDGGITWKGYGGAAYDSSIANDLAGGAITTTTDFSASGKRIDGAAANNSYNEGVRIQFAAGSDLEIGDRFTVDVLNPEMQAAQDAVINVDGTTITKSGNTVTDALSGVTLNLLQADSSSTLTLTVSEDTSSAKTAIGDYIKAYNTAMKFINDQLSYDPKVKKVSPLLGDFTLLEIRRKLGDIVSGRIPGLSSRSYTSLSSIGITSNKTTGQLSVNDAVLTEALQSDPEAVSKLFVGAGTPTDAAISYVGKTSKTQAGVYGIDISTAPAQASLLGGRTVDTLAGSEQLTFTFSDNHTESNPTSTFFTVSLSSGASLNSVINSLNSAFSTQGVSLTASNESGKIRIIATDYGADTYFKVVSDRGNSAGYAGFNASTDTTASEANGTDIAGSINAHAAAGKGKVLTATSSGNPEDGLSISTTTNQTGRFGMIAVSSGVAERLSAMLDTYTNASKGLLGQKADSIQVSVDRLKKQESDLTDRLGRREESLRQKFARLEVTLGQLNTQSQYITNQLAALGAASGKSK